MSDGYHDDENFFSLLKFGAFNHRAETHEGEELFAKLDDLVSIDDVDVGFHRARNLQHVAKRHGVEAISYAEQESLDDGESQRQSKLEARAFAEFGLNGDRTLEALEDGLNDVHSHAASGDFGDFVHCAEACLEDEVQSVYVVQACKFVGRYHAFFDGFSRDLGAIDSATVVLDLDDDLVALMVGVEQYCAFFRLAQS